MVSHHEQQASKWNGEQQHRVLWPAYNLNIAPPQASTEGLFQQTQALSLIDPGQPKGGVLSVMAKVLHVTTCDCCKAHGFRLSSKSGPLSPGVTVNTEMNSFGDTIQKTTCSPVANDMVPRPFAATVYVPLRTFVRAI